MPAHKRALAEFNEKVLKPGCNLKDLHILEKNEKDGGLGMKIIIKDILGNEMWNSGKYKKRSTLTVFCYKNHTWKSSIPEMPQVSSVCNMDLECERALASACIKTKEGKVNIDDKKIAEALISFVARELPKATRIWIIDSIPKSLLQTDMWAEVACAWLEELEEVPDFSQELKVKYNELEKFLEGAQSYRFCCWREREAYLGCEDSERSASEALPWVRQYGFSEQIQRRACVDNIESIRSLTGIVQLVIWEFSQGLHSFTAGLIGQHLTEKEGWIPTPFIDYLLSAGWFISATPREIIYSVGKKSQIEFPPDRDLAVRFVESCACNAQVTSVLIRNKNEADMINQWLVRKKCQPNRTSNEYGTLIKYEGDKKRAQWLHIRFFVLAYIHIAVLKQLKRFPIENVFYDKIFNLEEKNIDTTEIKNEFNKREKHAESIIVIDTPMIKYSQWRKKKPVGQGGSGKTIRAIHVFSNRKIVVLTPANLLAEYHRKQNPGLTAMTYHKYFHLGATAINEWDPVCLGKKTLAEILIFDEACMIPKKVLQRLLSYAESQGCQIIMCGDPGQLTSWGDKEGPHKFLTEWADEVIWCIEDYSAQDDELKALKLRMWMKNDIIQLLEFCKAIPKTTWENALAQWTPNNIWICSTNDMGMRIESALLQAHASHFPNEPSIIRFDPDDSIKHKYRIQEKPVQIPSSIEIIEAYKYAGWGTIHRIQGQTIEAPKHCFIVDHSLEVAPPNDILEYIELTELQATPCPQIIEAKLRRYKLNDCRKNRHFPRPLIIVEDWEVDNKSDLIKDSTVCEKPLFLAENDEKNAISSLTIKDIIGIAIQQNKCCKVCRVPLLFQGYPKHYPQSFSVDRLDDAEGHYRQNIRITCLHCNEWHQR
ncbi:2912_t:CDS:2 [Acaulospora morrowiae]|uniref:2912_t:CDS:1 n=1 Tax=Acaulospora morrowiae TaxID=94023 RepID=A0A9N8VWZ3_9GLOM|nr:2912_t:CDS:2 [Acaulospora morrowiae]